MYKSSMHNALRADMQVRPYGGLQMFMQVRPYGGLQMFMAHSDWV